MASGPGCSTHSGGLSRSAPQRSASQRSRLRLSLLIQDAYLGVAEEFCAAEPNFEALVASGAMAPQLAALLQARLVLALALTLTLTLALILP